DELDEDVEPPGSDDDVARLRPAADLLGHRLRGAGGAQSEHPDRVEPESERVRHGRHLQDPVFDEPCVAGPNRRLRDADPARDPPERNSAVALELLDDLAVDAVERAWTGDRTAS